MSSLRDALSRILGRGHWVIGMVPGGEVHAIPVADLIEHVAVECPCGPVTTPIEHHDGQVGWLVTHHSLDGREVPRG